jgi:hypothetical protein
MLTVKGLRAADLVHADHDQIGIELGLRAELDSRLGHDAKAFGAGAAQEPVEPPRHDLVNSCRPGAHDEPHLGKDSDPDI